MKSVILGGLESTAWNGCAACLTQSLAIRDRLSILPYAMQIQTQWFKVGLVHADIPREHDWSKFLQLLESHDSNALTVAIEGRTRIHSNDKTGVDGIDRIFVGHSVQRRGAKRFGNVFAIDTGAVHRELESNYGRDCALTMVNLSLRLATTAHPVQTALLASGGPDQRERDFRSDGGADDDLFEQGTRPRCAGWWSRTRPASNWCF